MAIVEKGNTQSRDSRPVDYQGQNKDQLVENMVNSFVKHRLLDYQLFT